MRWKGWVVGALKACVVAGLGLVVLIGSWWATRPRPTDELITLQEERLADAALRRAADSATVLLSNVVRELSLPSLSVAVGIAGEPVWEAAFGYADVRTRSPASLETTYRIGSVSKSLTALSLLRLMDEGVLTLDEEIGPLVPQYPSKRWPITFRQLASHTAGVRHYVGFGEPRFWKETLNRTHYEDVTDALPIFSDSPLLYEPGTSFRYTTHGYTLLSAAMESAAERPFLELMETELFHPLSMDATGPDDVTHPTEQQAALYMLAGGRFIPAPGADPSYKWGGGGFLSIPADLVRATGALLTDSFLSDSARTLAATEQLLADGSPNPQHYSLGWRVEREAESIGRTDSTTVMHHGGAAPGCSSFVLMVPDGGVSAALLTNLSLRSAQARPLRRMAYTIVGLFESELDEAN
jgi:serine beta-lactamase-like protein LACTB